MFNDNELAQNGRDKGCFALDTAKLPEAIAKLTRVVMQVKAQGDKKTADALVAEFVDGKGAQAERLKTITERVTRQAKLSFVYEAY